MDWDKLRIFHTVAETGSFTHAGDRLNLSQSAVSRQIRALEDELNVALFHRHARGLTLTQEGELLFQTAEDVTTRIRRTEKNLQEGLETPQGELKITTTLSFGSTWLTHNIREFLELYPEIDVQLLLSDQDLDLTTREADIAILFHPPEHADLIQRPLTSTRQCIYGSADYLARRGTPKTVDDLDSHNLITYGISSTAPIRDINWLLQVGRNGPARHPVLRINNINGALQAVRAGIGLAALPEYLVRGSSNVVRVLDDVTSPSFRAYLVYHENERSSKRIVAFRDYLLKKIADSRF
ncbi:LysR family transcriptional regulator [Alphaproteobacteria bacterium LMG 31809]|uniref:LysR family transcriptional regulator n=1 Tax=Govanella unica TaxID=2975056 RepID=A0A9X3TVQ2_9PROT|nr:LysR family transcriptional regulator [Govania unica]